MSSAVQNATAEAVKAVVGLHWQVTANELVTYLCVTIMALIPLYIGCHMSLTQKKTVVRCIESDCINLWPGK